MTKAPSALFTPVILGALHFASAGASTVASVFAGAEDSGLIDLLLLVGFIVGIWAVPRFGRIPMQVAGLAGMAIGMLLLTLTALADDGPRAHLWLVIASFVLFNFAMNAGPNAIRRPDRFSLNLRNLLSSGGNRLTSPDGLFGSGLARKQCSARSSGQGKRGGSQHDEPYAARQRLLDDLLRDRSIVALNY
jgi:hypothetical protein